MLSVVLIHFSEQPLLFKYFYNLNISTHWNIPLFKYFYNLKFSTHWNIHLLTLLVQRFLYTGDFSSALAVQIFLQSEYFYSLEHTSSDLAGSTISLYWRFLFCPCCSNISTIWIFLLTGTYHFWVYEYIKSVMACIGREYDYVCRECMGLYSECVGQTNECIGLCRFIYWVCGAIQGVYRSMYGVCKAI